MTPTRDHAEIREWAARHKAVPAEIKPHVFDSQPAVLYFLFGEAAKTGTTELHPITWDMFFAEFDLMGLALAYDERSSDFDLVRIEHSPQPRTMA